MNLEVRKATAHWVDHPNASKQEAFIEDIQDWISQLAGTQFFMQFQRRGRDVSINVDGSGALRVYDRSSGGLVAIEDFVRSQRLLTKRDKKTISTASKAIYASACKHFNPSIASSHEISSESSDAEPMPRPRPQFVRDSTSELKQELEESRTRLATLEESQAARSHEPFAPYQSHSREELTSLREELMALRSERDTQTALVLETQREMQARLSEQLSRSLAILETQSTRHEETLATMQATSAATLKEQTQAFDERFLAAQEAAIRREERSAKQVDTLIDELRKQREAASGNEAEHASRVDALLTRLEVAYKASDERLAAADEAHERRASQDREHFKETLNTLTTQQTRSDAARAEEQRALQDEIRSLRSEVSSLQQSATARERELLEKFESLLAALLARNEALERRGQQSQLENAHYDREQIASLRSDLDTLRAELSSAREEKLTEVLRQSQETMTSQFSQAVETLTQRHEASAAAVQSSIASTLQSRVTSLEQQLAEASRDRESTLSRDVASLREELKAQQAARSDAESAEEQSSLKEEVRRLRSELSSLQESSSQHAREENASLRSQLEALRAELSSVREEKLAEAHRQSQSEMTSQLTRAIESLTKTHEASVATMQSSVQSTLQSKITTLEHQLATTTRDRESATAREVASKKEELETNEELVRLRAEIASIRESQIAELIASLRELQAQASHEREQSRLRHDEEVRSYREELTTLRTQISSMQTSTSVVQTRAFETLSSTLERLTVKESESASVLELTKQMQALSEEMQALRAANTALQSERTTQEDRRLEIVCQSLERTLASQNEHFQSLLSTMEKRLEEERPLRAPLESDRTITPPSESSTDDSMLSQDRTHLRDSISSERVTHEKILIKEREQLEQLHQAQLELERANSRALLSEQESRHQTELLSSQIALERERREAAEAHLSRLQSQSLHDASQAQMATNELVRSLTSSVSETQALLTRLLEKQEVDKTAHLHEIELKLEQERTHFAETCAQLQSTRSSEVKELQLSFERTVEQITRELSSRETLLASSVQSDVHSRLAACERELSELRSRSSQDSQLEIKLEKLLAQESSSQEELSRQIQVLRESLTQREENHPLLIRIESALSQFDIQGVRAELEAIRAGLFAERSKREALEQAMAHESTRAESASQALETSLISLVEERKRSAELMLQRDAAETALFASRDKLATAEEESSTLKAALSASKQREKELQQNLREAHKVFDEKLRNLEQTLSRKETLVRELSSALRDIALELEGTKRLLHDQTNESATLDRRCRLSESEHNAALRKVAFLEEENARLTSELKAANEDCDQLRENLPALREALEEHYAQKSLFDYMQLQTKINALERMILQVEVLIPADLDESPRTDQYVANLLHPDFDASDLEALEEKAPRDWNEILSKIKKWKKLASKAKKEKSSRKAELESQVGALQKELDRLSEELRDVTGETIHDQIAHLRSLAATLEESERRRAELEEAARLRDADITECKSEISRLSTSLEQLPALAEEFAMRSKTQESKLAHLQSERDKLQTELEAAKLKAQALLTDRADIKPADLDTLRSELSTAQEDNQRHSERALQDQVDREKASEMSKAILQKAREAEEASDILLRERLTLQQKVTDLEVAVSTRDAEIARCKREIDKVVSSVKDLPAQAKRLADHSHKLETKIANLEREQDALILELEESQLESRTLKDERADIAPRDLDSLRSELSTLTTKAKRLKSLESTLLELRTQLHRAEEENTALMSAAKENQRNAHDLSTQLLQSAKEAEEASSALTGQLQVLRGDNNQLARDKAALETRILTLESQIEELDAITTTEGSTGTLCERVTDLIAERKRAQEEARAVEELMRSRPEATTQTETTSISIATSPDPEPVVVPVVTTPPSTPQADESPSGIEELIALLDDNGDFNELVLDKKYVEVFNLNKDFFTDGHAMLRSSSQDRVVVRVSHAMTGCEGLALCKREALREPIDVGFSTAAPFASKSSLDPKTIGKTVQMRVKDKKHLADLGIKCTDLEEKVRHSGGTQDFDSLASARLTAQVSQSRLYMSLGEVSRTLHELQGKSDEVIKSEIRHFESDCRAIANTMERNISAKGAQQETIAQLRTELQIATEQLEAAESKLASLQSPDAASEPSPTTQQILEAGDEVLRLRNRNRDLRARLTHFHPASAFVEACFGRTKTKTSIGAKLLALEWLLEDAEVDTPRHAMKMRIASYKRTLSAVLENISAVGKETLVEDPVKELRATSSRSRR